VLETTKWEFDKALNALSKLTTLNEFILGNSFTFADILVAQTLNWADRFDFELPSDYRDT